MIFDSVLVGVDGSDESIQACRLANRLRSPTGHMVALAVAETPYAVHAGFAAPEWAWRLRGQAEDTRERVLREFQEDPRVQARIASGRAADVLLARIRESGSDLVAVGSRGLGRVAGIVLGGVATRIVHDSPCSVLVVRGDINATHFPRTIIVGVDGSESSESAAALAEDLGSLADAHVRHLVALGEHALEHGKPVLAETDPRKPVEALVDHSRECDLLVVGSRGRHGLAALGSVAERVAHHSACPVLIVRPLIGPVHVAATRGVTRTQSDGNN